MFKGVSNWAPYWQFHFGEGGLNWVPYWQFHFGEGGGFQIGHSIGSFILGREGGFQIGHPIDSFILGREGGSTSAGRPVNFDSFSEIGYRTP